MLLDDLVFQLEHYRSDDWELGDQCFRFYKTQELVDQYARFWVQRPDFRPDRVFELGIWDGGSVAFWFECLQPRKHVAIDIQQKQDSAYFRRYVGARGVGARIATYWGVDQADGPRLRKIAAREFDSPLDLVVDDASHLYEPTRRSVSAEWSPSTEVNLLFAPSTTRAANSRETAGRTVLPIGANIRLHS
jgi:hypothetical protein